VNHDGGIHEIPLPPSIAGRLWLCGKHRIGPDVEALLADVDADFVVCLTEVHELADRYPDYTAWLRANQPHHALWHPVPDFGVPSPEEARQLFAELVERLQGGHRVIVHCAGGIGRSGTTAAALLVMLGMPLDDAIAHVRAHRPMAGPETGEQKDLVTAIATGR
jgi:protein-tyrosine phosphatase